MQAQIKSQLTQSQMQKIAKQLYSVFPKLSNATEKGSSGKIAIIGGSRDFTGAPYYSAISALKVGADLAHVFCSQSAAIPIKSYSPQIMVTPIFCSLQELQEKYPTQSIYQKQEVIIKTIKKWITKLKAFQKINAWVIGPGLGRDSLMTRFFPYLITEILPKQGKIVFDADGIFHLTAIPDSFKLLQKTFKNVILTPNLRQFKYVSKNIDGMSLQSFQKILNNVNTKNQTQTNFDLIKKISKLQSQFLKQNIPFNLLLKGCEDIFLVKNGKILQQILCQGSNKQIKQIIGLKINVEGGFKRCGGIGDILAGILGAAFFWNKEFGPILASQIVRVATKLAFQEQGRSMTAPNIIQKIGKATRQVQKYYLGLTSTHL